MAQIVEAVATLEIRSRLPARQRYFFLLLSVFPLLVPYQLLILPEWDSFLNRYFLLMLAVSLVAVATTAFFVWAALAGINSLLRFDKTRRLVTWMYDVPLLAFTRQDHPLLNVKSCEITKRVWRNGREAHYLKVLIADGSVYYAGPWDYESEILNIKNRVENFLGRAQAGAPAIKLPPPPPPHLRPRL